MTKAYGSPSKACSTRWKSKLPNERDSDGLFGKSLVPLGISECGLLIEVFHALAMARENSPNEFQIQSAWIFHKMCGTEARPALVASVSPVAHSGFQEQD